MNSSCPKRPFKDDPCDDEWDIPERLTAAHGSNKRMRQVTSQPLCEQGWARCHAGFDDVSMKEEDGRSYQKRMGRVKRTSLETSVLEKEQGSSLDIDWSSSSDNLSDIEPLSAEESRGTCQRTSQKRRVSRAPKRRSNPGRQGAGVRGGSMCESFMEGDELQIADEEAEGIEGTWMMDQSSSTTQSSQSQDKKINISDYDSPSEDQLTAPSSPQQASSSLHISDQSATPQPTPEERPTKESPKTGTEILKKLKLPSRTPDKEGVGAGGGGGDSAKKKRRFIRGGLADGLQRVINREQSSTSFWAHRTADTLAPQKLVLDLHVISAEEIRGLYVTRCQICPLTSEGTEEMFVLFTQANGRQLKLSVGSRVRVHPPWQKLTLPNYKEPVILCTYFCHTLKASEDEMPADAANQTSHAPTAECTSSETLLKPTRLFQPLASQTQVEPRESTLQSVQPHPSMEASNGHVSDSFLDCIAHSGAYSAGGMCVRAVINRVYFRGYSTDTPPPTRKWPGTSKCPEEETSLQATQWSLLLQDRHRVFCDLQVTLGGSREDEKEWGRSLRQGEGKTMVFAGLKVLRRVNRTRLPALFSLIDSRWLPGDAPISQSDTESQDSRSQGLVSPQNFCYILGVQTLRNAIRDDVPDGVRIPYRDPVIHTLRDIQQMPVTLNQRVTLYAKVIHAHSETGAQDAPQLTGSTSVWHLFLTDNSLNTESVAEADKMSRLPTGIDEGGGSTSSMSCGDGSQGAKVVHVYVRASCYLMESIKKSLVIPGCLVFLRDLYFDQCHLYADTYTSIQRLANSSNKQDDMFATFDPKDDIIINRLSHVPIPPIPDICAQMGEDSLVYVTGVVTGIDETSAYSWPACDTCGNNRLEADPDSACQLHCGMCQRSVTSPLTQMHLEVFLHCPTLEEVESVVKVRLLQSRIEQVLPPISSEEEGCDLQCIMGVHIGPISCFLKTVSRESDGLVTFELEEVSLETK